MDKKGNGLDLTNNLLQQQIGLTREIVEKLRLLGDQQKEHNTRLGRMEEQQKEQNTRLGRMEDQQKEHSEILRQIAQFIAKDRARQDRDIEELKRRVDSLERRAA